MGKPKKLPDSAPWTIDVNKADEFAGGKLRSTKLSGGESTMYVPGKKQVKKKKEDDAEFGIDSELRYSFQRNYQFLQQVFTIDTIVKPLLPTMGYYVSRQLRFFTRIFTQFYDPSGIADAQKQLGMGEEKRERRVC